ncbi:uncharacterized protein LAESUDRAFT_764513 [Laetiporus sulphureus 93-53]|uniref:Uncharacterized protein n=1 Tax=Laetiporus sulphureus 93-53 TaxID=1314785 RepID=A0A165B915_9APHY|nr:uncharacterized protein LAESUDRAFT_764513 [Laetiporus sulphureus 93-53]KZT00523.1 hypothetical protein LAESUDRAFT_764513 [Laetiporus sulphureus 93-53]
MSDVDRPQQALSGHRRPFWRQQTLVLRLCSSTLATSLVHRLLRLPHSQPTPRSNAPARLHRASLAYPLQHTHLTAAAQDCPVGRVAYGDVDEHEGCATMYVSCPLCLCLPCAPVVPALRSSYAALERLATSRSRWQIRHRPRTRAGSTQPCNAGTHLFVHCAPWLSSDVRVPNAVLPALTMSPSASRARMQPTRSSNDERCSFDRIDNSIHCRVAETPPSFGPIHAF